MSEPQKILLTGATGFVGGFVLASLRRSDRFAPLAAVRDAGSLHGPDIHVLGDFDPSTDWSAVLADTKVVIHCAARAHVLKEDAVDPLTSFRVANRDSCLALAKQAAAKGVKRFIFLSSIGVNGSRTYCQPYREKDRPVPAGPYAISKFEAEQGLLDIQRGTGMEVVIIRPPLVYGPNPPGNFGLLMKMVRKGVPLPLGSVHNRRSFVSVWNLVNFVKTCIDHPAAANQIFLVSDGRDVSTTELLRGIGRAMGKPARLMPVPAGMLMFGAGLLDKKAVAQRLLGSLQVDISKARNLLGWEPPLSVEEGLRRCFVSEDER